MILLVGMLLAACGGKDLANTAPSGPAAAESSAPPSESSQPGQTRPATFEEMALYAGGDRERLLAEKAKEEGELNFYTSMTVEDAEALTKAFTEKYGIKVNLWRISAEALLQRITAEAQAGRHEFDVADVSGPELEALYREGLLQKVESPHYEQLIPAAVPEHKSWVATRSNIFVQSFNTDKVKPEELPASWGDLTEAKWKGRLGIEASDLDWFATLVKKMGEEKGLQLFRDIVAANGVSVRDGHTLLTQLTVSGEVPLSLTVYNFTAETFKQEGAPIDWFAIPPAIAKPNGSAVSKHAPHPHAALLFYDFVIGEGQQVLADLNFAVTHRSIDTPYRELEVEFVDPVTILDEYGKWADLYNEIIVQQGAK